MTGVSEVLIVDDQPRARRSLRALLATSSTVGSVREAATGLEAIQRVEEACPDLVVMDVRMPAMDGLEATRLIKARWPAVKIVVLSMYPEYQDEALAAGADAFVVKGDPQVQLRYWHCMSYHEIAEVTGASVSAVKSRLHRARTTMGEMMMASDKHSVLSCKTQQHPSPLRNDSQRRPPAGVREPGLAAYREPSASQAAA